MAYIPNGIFFSLKKKENLPWTSGLIGWSVVLVRHGCRFNLQPRAYMEVNQWVK